MGWRRGHGYVVWCPLSPRYDDDFSVAIVISGIPDYYWIAVPSRSFLSINLSANIIEDDRERVRVVHETEPVGNVTIENDVVVDKVIDVDSIEKETKQHVRPVRVKQTADPQLAGKGGQGSVAVFTGDVKQTNAEPADVKDIEVVKKIKGNHKKEEAIGSAESATPEMRGSTGEVQGSEGGKKMKKPGTQEQMTVPEEGQTQPGEQPAQKKKKASTEQRMQPEEMQTQGGEQLAQKKKKASTEQQMQLQGEEQPVRKKRKAQEQQAEPMQNAQEPVQMKKARKEKASAGQCDPATGCPQ